MSDAPAPADDIRITGGDPTPEEVAAITAVLAAAIEELAGEHRRHADSGHSGWLRGQRSMRAPLLRGDWVRSTR